MAIRKKKYWQLKTKVGPYLISTICSYGYYYSTKGFYHGQFNTKFIADLHKVLGGFYETMIFHATQFEDYQIRHRTKTSAVRHHKKLVLYFRQRCQIITQIL